MRKLQCGRHLLPESLNARTVNPANPMNATKAVNNNEKHQCFEYYMLTIL